MAEDLTGKKLAKAQEWMDRAITQEEKAPNSSMVDRCVEKAVALEAEGLAEGETY